MLSERLKALRKEKKLKQINIANILNVSRSTYGHYETGHAVPNKVSMEKLSDFYDVSVDYLLGRTNEKKLTKSDNAIVAKAFSLRNDIDKLPQEALDKIDEYIDLIKMKYK